MQKSCIKVCLVGLEKRVNGSESACPLISSARKFEASRNHVATWDSLALAPCCFQTFQTYIAGASGQPHRGMPSVRNFFRSQLQRTPGAFFQNRAKLTPLLFQVDNFLNWRCWGLFFSYITVFGYSIKFQEQSKKSFGL